MGKFLLDVLPKRVAIGLLTIGLAAFIVAGVQYILDHLLYLLFTLAITLLAYMIGAVVEPLLEATWKKIERSDAEIEEEKK